MLKTDNDGIALTSYYELDASRLCNILSGLSLT